MAASTLNPNDAQKWSQWAGQYQVVSQQFATQFSALQQLGPYVAQQHPELKPQYDQMIAQGAQYQAQLRTLQDVYNTVVPWLQSLGVGIANFVMNPIGTTVAAGQDVFNNIENWWSKTFGVIPIIVGVVGVAAAAAVILAVANWINQSYQMTQRLNALYRLEQQGSTPDQAVSIVNRTLGSPGGSLFGIPLPWLFAGVAAIVLGPPLLNLLSGGRRNE